MSYKSNKPNGRPGKLTSQLQTKLCKYIEKGNYFNIVCNYCNIDYSTFSKWRLDGEKDKAANKDTIYSRFFDAIEKSKVAAEINAVSVWHTRIKDKKDWQAAEKYLARRESERWGPTENKKIEHSTGNLDSLKDVMEGLIDKHKAEY